MRCLWEGFACRFLHLAEGGLTLAIAANRFLLCCAEPRSRVGGVEARVELVCRVGHTFPIGRVVLPGAAGVRQTLTTDFIKVLNVNIDVVITVAIIAAVIPVIVMMVMIPVIIVIPVDIAENA